MERRCVVGKCDAHPGGNRLKGRFGVTLGLTLLVGLALGAGAWFGKDMMKHPSPPPKTVEQPPAPPPATPKSAEPSYDNIFPKAMAERVPVIMYHDIVTKRGRRSVWFDCTKAEFAAQMQWLIDQGAHPISLDA